jgi:hypothetical protein
VDEHAHYEFICREAGVGVEYCAEDFQNDGSFVSAIAKALKRSAAADYSRDLSKKSFAGHCRVVKLGFKQGGTPPLGLRRQLVDEHGNFKAVLEHGQRKHLQSDRVIFQPGPLHEMEIVRSIFHQCVFERKTDAKIARDLNQTGILNHCGRPWKSGTIRCILMNEIYIGNYLYNRRTQRLGKKPRSNAPSLWIRAVGVLEPMVDPMVFLEAQTTRRGRRYMFSDREMLARLDALLREKGRLSKSIIDAANFLPTSAVFENRFGSLRKAYKRIGYHKKSSWDFVVGPIVANTISELSSEIISRVVAAGGSAVFDPVADELTIEGHFMITFYVARCNRTEGGLKWAVWRRSTLRGDLIVALRMDEQGKLMDYLLLPVAGFPVAKMEFAEPNKRRLDACRFGHINDLFKSIWRSRNDPLSFPKILQGRQPLGYVASVDRQVRDASGNHTDHPNPTL